MYATLSRARSLRFSFDWSRLFPFLHWRDRMTRNNLRDDAMSGLTGALIVLPQAVAFATIAGLPPEYGLYAAMMPAVVAALFGSSWHLVSGPTTAISIAVFASVSPYAAPGSPEFIHLVLTLTFLTGVFQLALGSGSHGGAGELHFAYRGDRFYRWCGTAHRRQSDQKFLWHGYPARNAFFQNAGTVRVANWQHQSLRTGSEPDNAGGWNSDQTLRAQAALYDCRDGGGSLFAAGINDYLRRG